MKGDGETYFVMNDEQPTALAFWYCQSNLIIFKCLECDYRFEISKILIWGIKRQVEKRKFSKTL